jgi:hypothetical protein
VVFACVSGSKQKAYHNGKVLFNLQFSLLDQVSLKASSTLNSLAHSKVQSRCVISSNLHSEIARN